MGTKLIRIYPRKDQPGPGGAPFEIMPEYWYVKQLMRAFDVGCVLRHSTANATQQPGQRDAAEMTWTYGVKSVLNVATGRNPDGSYAIGVANPTGCPTVQVVGSKTGPRNQSIFANATTLSVEIALAELDATPLHFSVHRSRGAVSFGVKDADLTMQNGRLVVGIGPNELVTLRSTRALKTDEVERLEPGGWGACLSVARHPIDTKLWVSSFDVGGLAYSTDDASTWSVGCNPEFATLQIFKVVFTGSASYETLLLGTSRGVYIGTYDSTPDASCPWKLVESNTGMHTVNATLSMKTSHHKFTHPVRALSVASNGTIWAGQVHTLQSPLQVDSREMNLSDIMLWFPGLEFSTRWDLSHATLGSSWEIPTMYTGAIIWAQLGGLY